MSGPAPRALHREVPLRSLGPVLGAVALLVACEGRVTAIQVARPRPPATVARPAIIAAAAPAAPGAGAAPGPPAAPAEPPGVTFFVAADPHCGYRDVRLANQRMIDEMNALPGTAWPPELGGAVAAPRGVLVAGDLTENGRPAEWAQFVADFGLTGRDARLRFPVFEATGNHDRRRGRRVVAEAIRARHGGVTYSWDWNGVHLVSLDRYPTEANRQWLARDLARLRPQQQVVLFFHYNIEGRYSGYWSAREKAALGTTLAPHNVVAIFHGHNHPETRSVWQGIDVFDVGSPFWDTTFAVVHITARHLQVASWNWTARRWGPRLRKPLARPLLAASP